jgi:hypothetical protein
MRRTTIGRTTLAGAIIIGSAMAIPSATEADEPFAGPIFGLGVDGAGEVVVADGGRGVARANGDLIAELGGVTDVTASDQGWYWAITGVAGLADELPGVPLSDPETLFKVFDDGTVVPFADLGAFEAARNPHPTEIDSNPWSVVDLGGGEAAVADGGGNTLLKVNKHGKVKLIAVLPDELVPTDNAKALVEEILSNFLEEPVSCDALPIEVLEEILPPEDLAEVVGLCGLPPMIPAEPVLNSVAIGPDGDFYVGELKGFPAPLGQSKVWRIASNARNADCSRSPLCSVAYTGFTSILDLAFGQDGTLYVVEFDEKSWFAWELVNFEGLPVDLPGGTLSACADACVPVASGVPSLGAVTVAGNGDVVYTGFFGPLITL